MYPTTIALLMYSVFWDVNSEKNSTAFVMFVCPSVVLYNSELPLGGFSSKLIVGSLWKFVD